ncbi:MAG: hypothetical protein KGM42_14885 [Hyphomicrobiales bacterium]|nr:hypothetical protein [Hyphomicrobiales bacterium]
MGSYRISVRRDATDDEFNVIVHDETERRLGELKAFTPAHAELVARDLVSLVRKADPGSFFTLDLREQRSIAA